MAILPQLGRAPAVPTMPEKPSGFGVGSGQMWMDITGSVVDGAITAIGMQPKNPKLDESMQKYFDRMNKLNMGNNVSKGASAGLNNAQLDSFGFTNTSVQNNSYVNIPYSQQITGTDPNEGLT
jgi:hypothetical protein